MRTLEFLITFYHAKRIKVYRDNKPFVRNIDDLSPEEHQLVFEYYCYNPKEKTLILWA